jgi:hypothetical protein
VDDIVLADAARGVKRKEMENKEFDFFVPISGKYLPECLYYTGM